MSKEPPVTLTLSSSDLHLLEYAVLSLGQFFEKNQSGKSEWNKERSDLINSILREITAAKHPPWFYVFENKYLEFSMPECMMIDSALMKEGANAEIAMERAGEKAVMSSGLKFSDLAETMTRLLRRSKTAQRLTMLEQKVNDLTNQLEEKGMIE